MTKSFCQRVIESCEKHFDKTAICFFLILFTLVSYTNQKPKHSVYGKWESKSGLYNVILTLGDNDLLEAEVFLENKKTDTWSYKYIIVDEKTIVINTEPEYIKFRLEYKLRIKIKVESEDKITLECRSRPDSQGRIPIDFSGLCNFHEFRRLKE